MIRALLALVVLGLGGALAYQWSEWPSPQTHRETPITPTPGVAPDDGAEQPDPLSGLVPLDPLETYAAVTEQTLFQPDRKPPQPAADDKESEPEAEAEETSLDGMDLTAVIITPNLEIAWIKDPAQEDPVDLKVGEEHMGWTVTKIAPDKVVLKRQEEIDTLYLRDFTGRKEAAKPRATVPAPRARARTAPGRRPQLARPGIAQRRGRQEMPDAQGERRVGPPRAPPGARPGVPQARPNVRRPIPQRQR